MTTCFASDAIANITDRSLPGLLAPYFFVIGAGASYFNGAPPELIVPLADGIIQELREKWLSRRPMPVDAPKDDAPTMDRYEYWFRKVYMNAGDRQRYLREKILMKPIPPAGFRLASVLADGRISRLVVTTNFDLFISRALGLLEKETLVYDSAEVTNRRFTQRSEDIQILHVHGTYQYYDCANLRGEIGEQTKNMVGLVGRILGDMSPLVIGYSGWEGDVIMTALKRRLYEEGDPKKDFQRLSYNVYWFCYRESVLRDLPDWLKSHPDVCFVLPDPPCNSVNGGLIQSRESIAISQPADPTLSADLVLQRMIDDLRIPEGEIDKDPILFFVRRLQIYIRGLEDQQVDAVAATLKGLMAAQEKLQEIQKELYGKKPLCALRKSMELYRSPLDLGINRRRELMDAAWTAVGAVFPEEHEAPELRAGIDLVVALAEEVRARGGVDDEVAEKLARAGVYRGVLDLRENRLEDAIADFDAVVREHCQSTVLGVQDACSSAFVNKGVALCRKYSPIGPDDPVVPEILALYDGVIQAHRDSPQSVLRESVASALVNKGFLLNMVGRTAESQAAYDEAIARFKDAIEPSIQEHAVRALINKAFRLGESHKPEEMDAAIALYVDVVEKLRGTSRKSLRFKLTLAWNGLAFQRLLVAKNCWTTDPGRARQSLLQARKDIAEAGDLHPESGMVRGNMAYIEFLLGDDSALAHRLIDEAVRLGGEETREGEIADTHIFPLPQDDEFRAWIQAAPRAAESAAT